jgi:hypothetical protein
MEGYLSRNVDSFYSRQLLIQHNISVEDPLIVDMSENLKKKPFILFSTEKEIIYDLFKDCLIPKVKIGDIMTHIPDIENTQMYSDEESSKADKLNIQKNQ